MSNRRKAGMAFGDAIGVLFVAAVAIVAAAWNIAAWMDVSP